MLKRLVCGLLACATVILPAKARAQGAADDDAVLKRQLTQLVEIFRAPQRSEATPLPAQHVKELSTLGFDVIPVARELLVSDRYGTDAARAMLAIDEQRAMPLIFDAIPRANLSTQLVGFVWFLEHEDTLGTRADADAHAAALRVLSRIESTSMAQLALYTMGKTGGEGDFALLQDFASLAGAGNQGLRSASTAALARLGSGPHLDAIKAELQRPLVPTAGYLEAARVADTIRQAGLARSPVLVPAVCGHIDDPVITQIDIRVDAPKLAADALSLILEPVSATRPRNAPRRSVEQWRSYCRMLP